MAKKYEELLDQLFDYVTKTDKVLNDFTPRMETIGYITAKATILRLEATFSALIILMKKGFTIESLVLTRFILEQVAYSYEICKLDSFDDIEKIKTTKSINKYKQRDKTIGKFYGELSMFTHLDIYGLLYYAKIENNSMKIEKKWSENLTNIELFFTLVMMVSIYTDSVFGIIEELDRNNITFAIMNNLRNDYELFVKDIKKQNLFSSGFET